MLASLTLRPRRGRRRTQTHDDGRGPVHRSAKNIAGTGHKRRRARGGGRTDGGQQYRIDPADGKLDRGPGADPGGAR